MKSHVASSYLNVIKVKSSSMEQLGGSGIAWQIRFKVFIESKHERKI